MDFKGLNQYFVDFFLRFFIKKTLQISCFLHLSHDGEGKHQNCHAGH